MQKKVIITGVLGGIGSGLAAAFKEDGYFVIGLDIKPQKPSECDLFIQFDLHQYCVDETYCTEMNKIFEQQVDYINVLINNAAVQLLSSVKEIQLKDWQQSLNVNLTGPMLLSQFFIEKLEQSRGCIINIASIHQELTKRRFVAYATSKSALVGLTKSMCVDLQGKVRVNAISPAAIDTPMLHEGFDNDSDKVKQLNEIHPIQRIGKPMEVAKLALLLAEDTLGFINGANIKLDGGISNVLKDLE
jgi:NAD(P)-dependent dehydrogenase (short-subunit alcohol dehydrogenase family)